MKTNYLFKARWLQGAASANESKKMQVNPRKSLLKEGLSKDESSTRLRVDYDSFTCRLRVWPLKIVSVLAILLTIGVGQMWGVTVKDTISIVKFGSTSGTSYTGSTKGATNKGVEAYIGNFIPNTGQMKVNQGSTSATNGSNFFAYNSKAMPGCITKIELVITSGSTTASYCRIGTSTSAAVSSNVTWANSTASSLSSSIHSWTFNESDGIKFFRINWAKNGGTVKASYVVITYVYHTVTYSGNGNTAGSAPTDATKYLYNQTVTVQSKPATLAKSGYTFGGWNTNSSGTGTNYTAGSGTFKITSDVTLHAKWTAAASCEANPTIGTASLNGSFFRTPLFEPLSLDYS